jgi:hypothetical protein
MSAAPYDWAVEDPWLAEQSYTDEVISNRDIQNLGGSMTVDGCVVGEGATINTCDWED